MEIIKGLFLGFFVGMYAMSYICNDENGKYLKLVFLLIIAFIYGRISGLN